MKRMSCLLLLLPLLGCSDEAKHLSANQRKVLETLNKYVDEAPTPFNYYNRGLFWYRECAQYDRAKQDFETASKLDPRYKEKSRQVIMSRVNDPIQFESKDGRIGSFYEGDPEEANPHKKVQPEPPTNVPPEPPTIVPIGRPNNL